MSLILPHCVLDIFPTGKCINHGGEYGLENTVNFHFYRPKKSLNWPKNKITKSKLQRNCKTLSQVKFIQISYKKCLTWLVIGCIRYRKVSSRRYFELVPKNDVHYREVSAVKCPLHTRYENFTVILFVAAKSVRCREVCAIKKVCYKEVSLHKISIYSTNAKDFISNGIENKNLDLFSIFT